MPQEAHAPPGKTVYVSTVNVRIINSRYVPCTACHWYNVCAVPQSTHHSKLGEYKEGYVGTNRAYAGNTIFTCHDYTTIQ